MPGTNAHGGRVGDVARPTTVEFCCAAAFKGNLEMLRWMQQSPRFPGASYPPLLENALYSRNLEVIRWLHCDVRCHFSSAARDIVGSKWYKEVDPQLKAQIVRMIDADKAIVCSNVNYSFFHSMVSDVLNARSDTVATPVESAVLALQLPPFYLIIRHLLKTKTMRFSSESMLEFARANMWFLVKTSLLYDARMRDQMGENAPTFGEAALVPQTLSVIIMNRGRPDVLEWFLNHNLIGMDRFDIRNLFKTKNWQLLRKVFARKSDGRPVAFPTDPFAVVELMIQHPDKDFITFYAKSVGKLDLSRGNLASVLHMSRLELLDWLLFDAKVVLIHDKLLYNLLELGFLDVIKKLVPSKVSKIAAPSGRCLWASQISYPNAFPSIYYVVEAGALALEPLIDQGIFQYLPADKFVSFFKKLASWKPSYASLLVDYGRHDLLEKAIQNYFEVDTMIIQGLLVTTNKNFVFSEEKTLEILRNSEVITADQYVKYLATLRLQFSPATAADAPFGKTSSPWSFASSYSFDFAPPSSSFPSHSNTPFRFRSSGSSSIPDSSTSSPPGANSTKRPRSSSEDDVAFHFDF